MPLDLPGRETRRRAEWIILPALVGCWIFFAWASCRLFVLGDDANFLTEISQRHPYRVAISQYAYVWRPVYHFLGGDIAALRCVGALWLEICAATLGFALARFKGLDWRGCISLGGLLAMTAFWFYWLWNPTPNYNLLNLSGLMLFDAALLIAAWPGRADDGAWLFWTAALAGMSGGLQFLAKPPSCALAALLGLAWLFGSRLPKPWLRCAIAVLFAIAFILGAAFIMDGNIFAMILRIRDGLEFLHMRASNGQGYGILGSLIGPFFPGRAWKLLWVGPLCILIAATVLFWLRKAQGDGGRGKSRWLGAALSVALALVIGVSRAADAGKLEYFPLNHLWYLSVPLVLGIVVLRFWPSLKSGDRRDLLMLVVLIVTPFVYGFGTNSTIFRQMAGASVFWFSAVALVALCLPREKAAAFGFDVALFGTLATFGLLIGVAWAPAPWMAPLWAQTQPVAVGDEGKALFVDSATAREIRSLQQAADRAGLKPGTPIVDLGALGPGLAFALGGDAPVQAWLAYNRPTDAVFAEFALRRESPDLLRHSWIITTPQDRQGVAKDVLRRLGLDFPGGYEMVGNARAVERGLAHTLWKPRLNP